MEIPNNHLAELRSQAETLAFSPDRFGSLAGSFRKLAGSGFFTEWLNRQLALLRANPTEAGLWFWPEFNIERFSGLALSVRVFSEQSPLQTCNHAAIYASIGDGELHADVFAVPPYRTDVFDPTLQLRPLAPIRIAPGEVLITDTAHVYDVRCEPPVATAVLAAESRASLTWTFERATLKAQHASFSNMVDLQLRAATDILGYLKDPSSIAVLEEFSKHEHHSVRWAAIQNLGRIAPDEVPRYLERAIKDQHPHVRAAASKALEKLSESR